MNKTSFSVTLEDIYRAKWLREPDNYELLDLIVEKMDLLNRKDDAEVHFYRLSGGKLGYYMLPTKSNPKVYIWELIENDLIQRMCTEEEFYEKYDKYIFRVNPNNPNDPNLDMDIIETTPIIEEIEVQDAKE